MDKNNTAIVKENKTLNKKTYNYSLVTKIEKKNEKFGGCANAEMGLRSKSKTVYEKLLDRIALSPNGYERFFSPKT